LTSNQFFVPRLDPDSLRILLDGDEHHHLFRVARVREGETVRLFDGQGLSCLARVESVGSEGTVLSVLGVEKGEPSGVALTLALGRMPSKKMEFCLQKAAEMGISEFIPLETSRSLKIPASKSVQRAGRWERIAREAVKQSKGTVVPAVRPSLPFERFVAAPGEGRLFHLSERGGRPLKDFLKEGRGPEDGIPVRAVLAVGPEGGWTDGEEEEFRARGFETVSLGRRILKSETAALAAVAMVLHFWSR
jgi:16S rRNA (uracil1498-N3)-methyltransferase